MTSAHYLLAGVVLIVALSCASAWMEHQNFSELDAAIAEVRQQLDTKVDVTDKITLAERLARMDQRLEELDSKIGLVVALRKQEKDTKVRESLPNDAGTKP